MDKSVLKPLASTRALILGCKGQDGSFMCQSLLKKGYKVLGLSRSDSKKAKNHIALGIDKDVEIKKGNIKELRPLLSLIESYQPDHIYNLAAQSSVSESFGNPIETFETIVNGTLNILEASKAINFTGSIFFAGSSEIFGHTNKGADISHPHKPGNPYAIAKQTSFNLVKFYREVYNLNCMTGILFNHESNLRAKSFVTQKIIKAAHDIQKDKSIKLKLGNIEIVRDWGWAPEYIEAMQVISQSKTIKDHVICSGKPNSLRSFIQKSFEAFQLNWDEHVEIDQKLYRPSEIMQSYGNPQPLYKELGWKAKLGIDEIINKMVTGY